MNTLAGDSMLMNAGLIDAGLPEAQLSKPGQTSVGMTQSTDSLIEPDLMLLRRFTETGDAAVFAEIVQRYARVVYSASIRVLGDEGRAQDVSQETFFRLMQRPKLVTHSLAGWLHRTATHLALDVRRSEKSRRQRELTFGLEQQQNKPVRPSWADVSPYVDQALNEIQEPVRGLLIRHFLQGVPQADLAVELDVSPATLSRRIKSGLEELQQHLRDKGIHLGLSVLGLFCTSNARVCVPAKLMSELGKMHLVASIGHLPVTVTSPPPIPSPFPVHPAGSEFVLSKFIATWVGIAVVVIACAYATSSSWAHAHPFASSPAPTAEASPVAP
jgi:RNA polymerase sigma-70 factor (ECF subfamily)